MTFDPYTPAKGLLDTIDEGLAEPVGRSFVQVGGEVAWDNCCDGQLSVRVIVARPKYPNGPTTAKCGPIYWDLTVGISVLRCASTVNDKGTPPSPEKITEEAGLVFADMTEVKDIFENYLGDRLRVIDGWSPQGPNGGCAGGEWTLTMRIDA